MSYFQNHNAKRLDQQFLAGGSFLNWLKLLRQYGSIEPIYIPRVIYVTLLTLLSSPLRLYERLRFNRKINQTAIEQPPIFIVGHWRSGTTYLHQLLSLDPKFATVSMLQTMVPEQFLGTPLSRIAVEQSLPTVRPMDNVKIGVDVPEEEEYALGNIGPASFYHALCFPRRMRDIFDRYVIFEEGSGDILADWKKQYLFFLKKIAFCSPQKTLLLKNPANTGRIKALVDLFPKARFVYIYRNPYDVYASTMRWLDKEIDLCALQSVDESALEQDIFLNHQKLFSQYIKEKSLVSSHQLSEVSFEDLERNPVEEVQRIYRELGLEMSPEMLAKLEEFQIGKADYKKNSYQLNQQQLSKVSQHWEPMIKALGYSIQS